MAIMFRTPVLTHITIIA